MNVVCFSDLVQWPSRPVFFSLNGSRGIHTQVVVIIIFSLVIIILFIQSGRLAICRWSTTIPGPKELRRKKRFHSAPLVRKKGFLFPDGLGNFGFLGRVILVPGRQLSAGTIQPIISQSLFRNGLKEKDGDLHYCVSRSLAAWSGSELILDGGDVVPSMP